MSDDVFAVRTTFNDVAELGQGYLERADGERMLLPLPLEVSEGEGVRFIVYLADGTPAFAGAGRAVQVSDQGEEVAAEDRYETLIDGLVFDERSRPVYDYIVAVRQMAYADLGAAAEAEAAHGEEAVLDSEGNDPAAHTAMTDSALMEASMTGEDEEVAHELTAAQSEPSPAIETEPEPEPEIESEPEPAYAAPEQEEWAPTPTPQPQQWSAAQPRAARQNFNEVTPADHNAALSLAAEERASIDSEIPRALDLPDHEPEPVQQPLGPRSVMPLPTGILHRPAIAQGWQPRAPKRPQPSEGSGKFRYRAGELPVPQRPPRPDLAPEYRVQPAAAPN